MTTRTATYRIRNRSTGEDFGTFEGVSDVDALAAMHCAAGYDVALDETGGELVFESDHDTDICGGFDRWSVCLVSA